MTMRPPPVIGLRLSPNPLKAIRVENEFSIRSLHLATGLSRKTLTDYEQRAHFLDEIREGSHGTTLGILVKIADAIGLPIRLVIGDWEVDLNTDTAPQRAQETTDHGIDDELADPPLDRPPRADLPSE